MLDHAKTYRNDVNKGNFLISRYVLTVQKGYFFVIMATFVLKLT